MQKIREFYFSVKDNKKSTKCNARNLTFSNVSFEWKILFELRLVIIEYPLRRPAIERNVRRSRE